MHGLIERAAARERFASLLADAEAGRGRCVLVEGEAGIGKSAPRAAAGGRARGMRVLDARCAPDYENLTGPNSTPRAA